MVVHCSQCPLRGTVRDHMKQHEYLQFLSVFMEPGYGDQTDYYTMWPGDDEPVYEEVDMLTVIAHNPAISAAVQQLAPAHKAAVEDVFRHKMSFFLGCVTDTNCSFTHEELAQRLPPKITCEAARLLNYLLRTEGVEQVMVGAYDCSAVLCGADHQNRLTC
jgi:hypothetical protein